MTLAACSGVTLTTLGTADAALPGTPTPPTSVSAHAAVNAAKVYWQPPADSGDSPVSGYTATASPGGQTCSTASSGRSCKVTGLSNGASYTFTVTATNATGTSDPSSPSNAVTPAVDTTNPVLVSSSVTPTRVSSATGGNVTVELRITDDLSGIRSPSGSLDANPAILFGRTDGTGSSVGFTRAMTRVSGDEYDGIYRATTNIPAGTSPGSWDLTVYPIDDNAGNNTFFIDRPGIMVGTPAAPTGVTASPASVETDRDVTISWNAADDGGQVITQYRVSGTGGKTFTTTGATSLTTSAYANWPTGTPVSFTVVAVNSAGSSPASAASAPLTIPAAAPSAPNLTSAVRGHHTIAGTWTAPAATGGDAAVSYTLTATPGGDSCTTTALTCTISGLTNGQQFTVAVVATNSGGDSAESNTRTATPATTPTAPANVTATAAANRDVTISWDAADDGGSAITGYQVSGTGGKAFTTTGTSVTTSAYADWPASTLVSFTVTATNILGTSPASPASTPLTIPAAAPSVPNLTDAVRGNESVAGTWTAPASSGGDTAVSYTLTAAPGGASCTTTALSCTIVGLTNGSQYTLTVAATNSGGTSPESNSKTATPATVPAAPAAPQVTVSGSDLNVTWTAPASDGGAAVTGYTATARSGATVGDTCTSSTIGCILTVPDGNWAVEVVATNPVGAGPASPASAPVPVDTKGPAVSWSAAQAWAPVLTGTSTLRWAGTDVSGVASYQVQRREARAGAPFGTWVATSQTGTSVSLKVATGRTVCVRVAGVDAAGNTGTYTSAVCRTSPVDDRSARTSGKAKRVTGSGYFAKTATVLTAKGAQLKFSGVRASAATLVATTCSTCGKVQVLYGTKVVKTVSLKSSRTVNKKLITLPATGRTTTITLRSGASQKVILDGLVLRAR